MILIVERLDGARQEIPLDATAGAGIAVQIAAGVRAEPLPLAQLTGLELKADPVNPVLVASMGKQMRPYPLDPASTIEVGWEDHSAPILSSHGRHASFVVSELASVQLDLDRLALSAR